MSGALEHRRVLGLVNDDLGILVCAEAGMHVDAHDRARASRVALQNLLHRASGPGWRKPAEEQSARVRVLASGDGKLKSGETLSSSVEKQSHKRIRLRKQRE